MIAVVYMLLCHDCNHLHTCQTGQTLKTQYTQQIRHTHANNTHSPYATQIHLKLKIYGNVRNKAGKWILLLMVILDNIVVCQSVYSNFQCHTFIWVPWWWSLNMYTFNTEKITQDETILKLQFLYTGYNKYFQNSIQMIACCFWLNHAQKAQL
jgi:hypothetical protein